MSRRLGPLAYGASIAVVLDEVPHTRPYILPTNEFHSLVLAEVPQEWMVALVLENSQVQVGDIRNIYVKW